jgi:hypothetical protein
MKYSVLIIAIIIVVIIIIIFLKKNKSNTDLNIIRRNNLNSDEKYYLYGCQPTWGGTANPSLDYMAGLTCKPDEGLPCYQTDWPAILRPGANLNLLGESIINSKPTLDLALSGPSFCGLAHDKEYCETAPNCKWAKVIPFND